MAIAGHVSLQMLQRYSHLRLEAKRRALDALTTLSQQFHQDDADASYDTKYDTIPTQAGQSTRANSKKRMVGANGFEPSTSWSRTRRASQAALRPDRSAQSEATTPSTTNRLA